MPQESQGPAFTSFPSLPVPRDHTDCAAVSLAERELGKGWQPTAATGTEQILHEHPFHHLSRGLCLPLGLGCPGVPYRHFCGEGDFRRWSSCTRYLSLIMPFPKPLHQYRSQVDYRGAQWNHSRKRTRTFSLLLWCMKTRSHETLSFFSYTHAHMHKWDKTIVVMKKISQPPRGMEFRTFLPNTRWLSHFQSFRSLRKCGRPCVFCPETLD